MQPVRALIIAALLLTSGARPAAAAEKLAITATVAGRNFAIVLDDSAATRALIARLPLKLHMSELNGNEKYAALGAPLPTRSERPGQIRAGDFMLFGDDCLVLFYETFPSAYSYTRLGRAADPGGLSQALGDGGVTVLFEQKR
ncbi:MAG: cyclophilin-like fold protein [Pyramidobacter sp.]|uniref:cyclophilin-like fold protein n=1 Tax=Pyramidobacter sp. TaxID=1943581 RepID=UPI002A7EAEC7|nr:cyclophilin-like fold protein [Pyramidobacter sp.]MDY4032368.1 cyclophilin-like fold protein [Pyramidobacter sp.]